MSHVTNTQYRHGIYYHTPEQKATAEASMKALGDTLHKSAVHLFYVKIMAIPKSQFYRHFMQ